MGRLLPEVFEIAPRPRWRHESERVASAIARRWRRWFPGHRWTPPSRASDLPFRVTGFEPPFDELEAIVTHPRVLREIEEEPANDLVVDLPAPRFPTGFESLGWTSRTNPAPVYDVIPFALELDVLEMRLAELETVVDRFVVVECERAFSGIRKPLFFDRNKKRFQRFLPKIEHVILDAAPIDAANASRIRRTRGFEGEEIPRAHLWRSVVSRIPFERDAVIIWSDVDEIPSRDFVHLMRHFAPPGPIRLVAPALRYRFDLFDEEATNHIVFARGTDLPYLDRHPEGFRAMHGTLVHARRSVHLTSFFGPLGLVAKFALATEWPEGLVPFIRNEHDETAAMIAEGSWFGRPAEVYDPEADPRGVVPLIARANRGRYARYWADSRSMSRAAHRA